MSPMPGAAGRREWIALSILALPTLLVSMDMSILFLAGPSLSTALRPSGSELLWISDIYGFLLAGALIPMGTIADRFGRRRLLLIGALFFGIASVLAAYAKSPVALIGARALMGIAGATLLPSTLALIRNLFHAPQQRSFAIGIWTTCFTLGGVLGPIVGGFLLERFWWGSVFLIGVPIMLGLLLLGPIFLPEFRKPIVQRLDILSVAQSVLSLLAIIYAIKHAAEHGITPVSAVSLASGLVLGALFLSRQTRLSEPLIDLALFRNTAFITAIGANTSALFAWGGASLLVAQYLQLVIGLSPMSAGLWTIPAAVGSVIGGLAAAALSQRRSNAVIVSVALFITAVGLGVIAGLTAKFGLAAIILGMMLLGLGVAAVVTLGTDVVLAAVPPEKAGAASAISETGADLGGALGVALLGSVGVAVYRATMTIPPGASFEQGNAARDTLGAALGVAARLPVTIGSELRVSAQSAFSSGFGMAIGTGSIVLFAVTIIFAWASHRRPSCTSQL